MKSALSLTLITCLAGSALPASAEQPTPGPIARAITREAAQFAANPGSETPDPDWLRVQKVEAGKEIIVTLRRSNPVKRYFLSANESSLTVLNLTDPTLSQAVTNVLREVALHRPQSILAVRTGGTLVLEKNLRLGPDGLFVANRKIADLQHIVETNPRIDVAEVGTRRNVRGLWGHLGGVGGYFVGSMAGGYGAGLACQAALGRGRCDTGAFLGGMVVGGITGLVYGLRAEDREIDEVIYRARLDTMAPTKTQ